MTLLVINCWTLNCDPGWGGVSVVWYASGRNSRGSCKNRLVRFSNIGLLLCPDVP